MNRLVAQVFAGCLAVLHAAVLGGLALTLLGALLNRSQPAPLRIAGAAIDPSLERLARAAGRDAGIGVTP